MQAYEKARSKPTTAERANTKREELKGTGIVSLGIKREDGRIDALGVAATAAN